MNARLPVAESQNCDWEISKSICPRSWALRTNTPSTSRSCGAETGYITLDDSYGNTGATTSAITYLDGEQGILRYRGYPIEVLAERCGFIEVAWLLIHGELPTAAQLQSLKDSLRRHTMIHEDMRSFYSGFPRDAHPMGVISSVVVRCRRSTRIRSTRATDSKSRSRSTD